MAQNQKAIPTTDKDLVALFRDQVHGAYTKLTQVKGHTNDSQICARLRSLSDRNGSAMDHLKAGSYQAVRSLCNEFVDHEKARKQSRR